MNILYITVYSIYKKIDITVRFHTYNESIIIIKDSIHNVEQQYYEPIVNIMSNIYTILSHYNASSEFTHVIISEPCKMPISIQFHNEDSLYKIRNTLINMNRIIEYNGVIHIGNTLRQD